MDKSRTASLAALALTVLYALSHVLAERPYVDDLGRTILGSTNWSGAGRPAADIVMPLLNLGTRLTDLSPLPQLLGIALVAWGCWLIAARTIGEALPPLAAVGCAFLLLLNPSVLENMAYKFDAFEMGLAMLCAIAPVLLRWERFARSLATSIVLVMLSLSLYQAAVNITAGLAVVVVVLAAVRRDDPGLALKQFGGLVLSLIAGLVIYALVVPGLFVSGPYPTAHSEIIAISGSGLAQVGKNLSTGLRFIQLQFAGDQIAAMAILAAAAQLFALTVAVSAARGPGPLAVRAGIALVVVLSPTLTLLASVGILTVLKAPFFGPRVAMGFGPFLLLVVATSAIGLKSIVDRFAPAGWHAGKIAAAAVVAVPVLFCLNVAYGFSAAERAQYELDADLVSRLRAGLFELKVELPAYIVIVGDGPAAARVTAQGKRYPIITRMTRSYFDEGSYFSPVLLRYYGIGAKNLPPRLRESRQGRG